MAQGKPLYPTSATEWQKQTGLAVLYMLLLFLSTYFLENVNFNGHFEPAGGLALATLIIGGMQYTWGLLMGGILCHVFLGEHFRDFIPGILGDTSQAVLGAWLLARKGFDWRIWKLRQYFDLVLLGGVVSVSAGALIVTSCFLVFESSHSENYLAYFQHWWMGDTLGIVLITPFILAWVQRSHPDWKEITENVLLIGVTTLAGQIVFWGWLQDSLGSLAQSYWMFLFIAWIAMVLGVRATTLALLLVAMQALTGAIAGKGAFATDISSSNLVSFWFYLLILSLVGMSLATYFMEIKEANSAVVYRNILIREIHHRVKNNLQGVTGLLRQVASNHPEVAEPITRTIGQLKSIAVTHELQEQQAAGKIRLPGLVKSVAATIGALWQRDIGVEITCPEYGHLIADRELVPLALVINELISNAVKHGAGGKQISLLLEPGDTPDSIRLVIRNASEKPGTVNHHSGQGLELVKSLLPPDGASFSLSSQNGTMITKLEISPPVIEPENRT